MKPKPIAVCCGDLHLSLLKPACRADDDWLSVQAGYLDQLKDIADDLPILCAGDIFDRWNTPPELVNFALHNLPNGMFSIPGQHDLPNHQTEQMHRSGYGVLEKAKHIRDVVDYVGMITFDLFGFGWGEKITPHTVEFYYEGDPPVNIALIHRYVWTLNHKYPDAPKDANVAALKDDLVGYDLAITGDNHHFFMAQAGKCTVFNCGTFLRRKTDEIPLEPSVGMIYSDGSIERIKLDTSKDKFHQEEKARISPGIDMKSFIDGLEKLGEHGLNFREEVENFLRKEEIEPDTKQIILSALDAT